MELCPGYPACEAIWRRPVSSCTPSWLTLHCCCRIRGHPQRPVGPPRRHPLQRSNNVFDAARTSARSSLHGRVRLPLDTLARTVPPLHHPACHLCPRRCLRPRDHRSTRSLFRQQRPHAHPFLCRLSRWGAAHPFFHPAQHGSSCTPMPMPIQRLASRHSPMQPACLLRAVRHALRHPPANSRWRNRTPNASWLLRKSKLAAAR